MSALDAPGWKRLRPRRSTLVWGAVLLNTELLLVLAYVFLLRPTITDPRFYAYPFVWFNAALWGVARVAVPPASDGARLRAGALAAGYFGVLAVVGGLVGPAGGAPVSGARLVTTSLPPGWAPALLYSGATLKVAVLPFKLAGYLALAYLVYAAVLDAAGSVAGGVLGLFSCVSCVLPVAAAVASSLLGGGGALLAAATAQTYGLSTVVYVLTVGLLVWRPVPAGVFRSG